jgi:hypothetical protein
MPRNSCNSWGLDGSFSRKRTEEKRRDNLAEFGSLCLDSFRAGHMWRRQEWAITGNDPASLDHLVGAAEHLVNNPPW